MFSTILVAVDGSNHSMKSVDLAADFTCQNPDIKLIILNVYKHMSALENTHSMVRTRKPVDPPDAALHDWAEEIVEVAAKHARDKGVKDVQTIVRRGPPARTIVAVAKEVKADAIVMGSRGLGDIGTVLMGSISHKVSNLAECTCITVK